MNCDQARNLLALAIDDAIDSDRREALMIHLRVCAECRAADMSLSGLSTGIRAHATRHVAPPGLAERLARRLDAEPRAGRLAFRIQPRAIAASLAAIGIAGMFALFAIDHGADAGAAPLLRDVINAHGRSLMEGRLTDIAASDQHVVKPWFGARVPLAPPVRDLTTTGFPLVGGRADFIDGRVVPVIVYRHRLHAINVFAFAADRVGAGLLGHQQRHGFNTVGWRQGDFFMLAASDLNSADLDRLADYLRAESPR